MTDAWSRPMVLLVAILLLNALLLLWLLWRHRQQYAQLTDLVPGLGDEEAEDPEVAANEALIAQLQVRDCLENELADLFLHPTIHCRHSAPGKHGYRLAVKRQNMRLPHCRACTGALLEF